MHRGVRGCKGECKGRCKRVQGRGCEKEGLRKGVCGAVALAHSSGKMDCSRCSRSTLSLSSPCSSSSAYVTSSAKYGVNDVSERIAVTGGGWRRSRLCSELQKKMSCRRACRCGA